MRLYAYTGVSQLKTATIRIVGMSGSRSVIVSDAEESPLQSQLSKHVEYFRVQNKVKGKVVTRIKGLATYDNIVAMCIILVPDDKFEFRGSIEELATILFTQNEASIAMETFPWEKKDQLAPKLAITTILDLELRPDILTSTARNPISLRILYSSLCLCILIEDDVRADRCRDAQSVVETLESSFGPDMTEERKLLASLCGANPPERQDITKAVCEMSRSTMERCFERANESTIHLLDLCPACRFERPLFWGTGLLATCSHDHEYTRCSLTFLPLLNPRWSKICMDCGREFLNERNHPEMQSLSGEKRLSEKGLPFGFSSRLILGDKDAKSFYLATYLLSEFDKCPYCNGFFSG